MKHSITGFYIAPIQSPDIRLRHGSGNDFLFFAQHIDGGNLIPQSRRPLKVQRFGLSRHLFCQRCRHLLHLTRQQQNRLINAAAVLLFAGGAAAEAIAAAHVEIQARALLTNIPWELAAASGQAQRAAHRIQRSTGFAAPTVRAKIFRPILAHGVGEGKDRIFLLHRQPDKRIAFIILEQNIVSRHVLFNERIFQDQRLKFTGGNDGIKVIHPGHHAPRFFIMARIILKILTHPVFQFFCFAHINHRALNVHHNIDAGTQRQAVGFFLQFLLCQAMPPPHTTAFCSV